MQRFLQGKFLASNTLRFAMRFKPTGQNVNAKPWLTPTHETNCGQKIYCRITFDGL